ncbi:MAG TPA: RNA polymerase sigma factor [Solirubrobacterales bacterium]|nr:RNA polymerase sigma factor [Solirubrobacterales bacterium]
MSEAAAAGGFSRLLSDERLARRAVSGDEHAFAAIFRRYHQPLYRFCLALVGNPEDAQDALQNTMVKVLRALPGEERRIELKPWLYRIARNESVDLLRRRRETRQIDANQAAPGASLTDDVARRERLRQLLTDLDELPERQREALVMRELGGLGFEEIGSALGTSGAVARQTLYEARQSLHQMEEGREMNCDAVTLALSDGDGRVARRRDIRAHLRTCTGCRRFRDEIKGRERDLAALAPLPALAATGMLQGLVGGGHAAGGGLAAGLGGGAAKTIAASSLAKGVATVAVVAAVGVTAADRTGAIHLGLPGDGGSQSSTSDRAGSTGSDSGTHPGSGGAAGGAASAGAAAGGKPHLGPGARHGRAEHGTGHPGAGAGHHGHGTGRGQAHGDEMPNANGYGPGATHPQGLGHEQQHPPAAEQGQETAGSRKPTQVESGGEGAPGSPPKPAAPPTPDHPAAAPKEPGPPPQAPEGAAPEPPVNPEPSAPQAGKGAGTAGEKAPS